METIKIIDEKTIERNGIKYVPDKAEEPEFKVGQWVKVARDGQNASNENSKFISYLGIYAIRTWRADVFKIASGLKPFSDPDISRGSYLLTDAENNEVGNVYEEGLRPATKEEIEAHLRKICERYVGKKVKSLNSGETRTVKGFYEYNVESDTLFYNDVKTENIASIYKQGKFAEIIPDKKPKPVTREDFEKFLAAYEGNYFNGFAMSSFLNDYLF